MKKNILSGILFASLLLFAGCDYNEDNFPGYDEYTHIKDIRNDTVTLVKADYKKIAGLDANKELALSKDPEGETYAKALEQIISNGYFTEDAPAVWYLPAYIESLYPYLSNDSKVLVNYQNTEDLPAYMADFNGIKDYNLTSDDYKLVWNEGMTASFLSPSTLKKLPEVLKAAKPDAQTGDMLLVNYAYSETEPSTGGGSEEPEPEPTYTNIADVLQASSGTYTSKGEVVAVNAKSFIFSDETGSIRVYRGNLPTCAIGDIVEVSGEVEKKQELTRFRSGATFKVVGRKTTFSYPAPTAMSTADMVAYVSSPDIRYVSYEGTLKKSGNYVNILLDGEETVQGSIIDALILDESLDGKQVVVTGYLAGVNGDRVRYINTFATSIVPKGETNAITPIGVIALSEKGTYTAKGVVSALYTKGFMLTDGTGSILVYKNTAPIEKIGDVVQVTGSTSTYNGLMQFGNKGLEVKPISENNNAVASMVPQAFVADDFNAYIAAPRPVYMTFEGVLSIKDSSKGFNYYDVTVDGLENQISLSYVDDNMVDPALNGKTVIINSYLIGVKDGQTVQAMLVSVTEATATAKAFGTTRAAGAVKANASAIYRYDATSWKLYEPATKDIKLSVLQPADYIPMGYNSISDPSVTLPVYLSKTYPYAKADEKRIVAYYYYADKTTTVAATEFTYDGATWIETATVMPAHMLFVKSNDKWIEAKVYYENSLLDGDDGGFTIQDIELGGLSKVWSSEKSYGWKATGYDSSSGSNMKTESWIVSPEISLKKAAAPTLKFDVAVNHLKGNELSKYFAVKVSTDYVDDVTKATWKDLTIEGWPTEDSWAFVTVNPCDLSAYKDQTIRLAFQYKSDEKAASTAEVKNVSIQE